MIRELRLSAPYGHVCWSYDDRATFDSQARDYLAAGLAAGERVWYVGSGQPGTIAQRLGGILGWQEALRRGTAHVALPTGTYAADGGAIDPVSQVGVYAAATEDALTAGYTGLRVVADATSQVRTPAQLEAFLRYEHLVDRYMRTRPMSAMCAYDRVELGDRTIQALACMHPQSNVDDAGFRLYACTPVDGCVVLTGELDLSNHQLFAAALERADLRPVDGRLTLQAATLRFVDHRSLMFLHDYARRRDAVAVLRTSRSTPARVVDLLGLSAVRVEVTR